MRHLTPLDRALVLILVPLWMVTFGLSVKSQLEGRASIQIGLSLDVDGYPVVRGDYGVLYEEDPLAAAGVRPGDRLLRVGSEDLRGVRTYGLMVLVGGMSGDTVAVEYEREGERRTTRLPFTSIAPFRAWLGTSLAFFLSAIVLLLRARPTPTVRAYVHAAFCFAIGVCVYTGSELLAYAWFVTYLVAMTLVVPLLLRFALLFPDDRVPAGRWHRVWPWIFVLQGGFQALTQWGLVRLGQIGANAMIALGLLAIVAVVTHKYRLADPVARRQIRLAILGFYLATIPIAIGSTLLAFDSRFGTLQILAFWAAPIFPAVLVLSMVRFNLFDVDRVISAAASYNALLVVLGAGALVLVPRLAESVSALVGVDPATGQIALSLLLAGVVVPAHRRLRPQIDRVFFKDRYAVDHGVAELLPELARCRDARELTARVGEELQRLLRPDGCVVYARTDESFAPVFAEGRAVPPAFDASSPLVGTLETRRKPLALGSTGRRADEASLDPFDRAALETLGAEVVVPVHRGEGLVAFLCLGPKRSGDVYTPTDVAQLAAVGETVSLQLERFDQDAIIREGREMQQSLRRYVPGAIAEQLSSGAELHSGEREVSVLFVDIRGYTGFSEGRRVEEIFSAVNRYTETVSRIVRQHGGCVVEFNGDGMMAVFGAPQELSHKERAAVEAGRDLVSAVPAIPVTDADGAPTSLSVGVGIATGEAFVGNIQAVDRMIWSAIGNTTNLAARLQGMTRDLDASLVIDRGTWERAEGAATGFEERPGVPIRGRREAQDLFSLPIMQPAPPSS